jgi:hypothetical protein
MVQPDDVEHGERTKRVQAAPWNRPSTAIGMMDCRNVAHHQRQPVVYVR